MARNKKKKKQAYCSSQQEQRTRMNVFYRNMYNILAAYQCEEFVGLMPQSLKRALYNMRTPSFRFTEANCPDINREQYNEIIQMVSYTLKKMTISLNDSDGKTTLSDFYTMGYNLRILQEATQTHPYENGERMHELLTTRLNLLAADEKAMLMLANICHYASAYFSSYTNYVVTVHPEFPSESSKKGMQGLQLIVSTHKVPVHYFKVNGHIRPAFAIGLTAPERQLKWLSMNRALFDHTPFHDQLQTPVYVQSHTFQRLAERLDLMTIKELYFDLRNSILRATVIRYKRYHLIEYRALDCKLGYLVADLIDGKLLVKTFLFLPSDGTPEGEKLEQLCGLTKVDMQYLKIDHLSAFHHTDIKEDARLKKLFCDAGCESLFDFCERQRNKNCRHDQLSSYIIQYIQLDQEEEQPAIAG
ncbi:hypothetical protein [Mangrovibacterium marinum]|uniref:Uncharacterized protein n=1 Tax=Mangrovibacterium marinum TaxID=1639118 RepID=A0A2T5C2I6_9BACT|nr:hypothetical protein [Mangrovibacterium marinum]PTN08935.1 hypothetical protein C8N47_10632 [Mangrovibacterium marinum]